MSILTLPAAKELQSRFLYPFFFKRDSVQELSQAFLAVKVTGKTPLELWECSAPHEFYKEELLDHVEEFLFSSGCSYLKLTNPVTSRWFNSVEVQLKEKELWKPLHLVERANIEIFLSRYGSGVLSISLEPGDWITQIKEIINFNYHLSKLRFGNAARLRIPHPQDDPAKWGALPQNVKDKIPAPPNDGTSIEDRLGKAGGIFTPAELVEELMKPAKAFEFRKVQDEHSLFTVARFKANADFGMDSIREEFGPLLSCLAQVEETGHSGFAGAEPPLSNAVLNRRHWVAVGLLGVAHLVSDQEPPDHPFNEQRMPRVFLKYFIPYLVALFQRLTLHRIVEEAGNIMTSWPSALPELRSWLLEFSVHGFFTHLSVREVLHRYYRLCQNGLDVPDALAQARGAIAEIDARQSTETQIRIGEKTAQVQEQMAQNVAATTKLQQDMEKHLGIVARVQRMLEWIEIFLVSVYAAHLWEMFASHVEAMQPYIAHGVLFWAFVGGFVAFICLKPWKHRENTP